MRELLAGGRSAVALVKLPLTPPSITLLTAEGPYADIIREGQKHVGGDIMNVSVMAGFVFSDCPKNGYSVIVTARNGNRSAAAALACELAELTWSMRNRFRKTMTTLAEAVALAWYRWPGERLYTYVNPKRIKSDNPGYCFKIAGWKVCGVTKVNKLVILELLPE